jgi:hypothetical protein
MRIQNTAKYLLSLWPEGGHHEDHGSVVRAHKQVRVIILHFGSQYIKFSGKDDCIRKVLKNCRLNTLISRDHHNSSSFFTLTNLTWISLKRAISCGYEVGCFVKTICHKMNSCKVSLQCAVSNGFEGDYFV